MERIEEMKRIAKEIQKNFRMFYLAGGTSLMFKYNHRISEDLDFLSERKFPDQNFEIYLGAVLSIEDYPDLDKGTIEILEDLKSRWEI